MKMSRSFGGVVLCAAALFTSDVLCFQPVPVATRQRPNSPVSRISTDFGDDLADTPSITALSMSSIPEDDDNNNFNLPNLNMKDLFVDFKLPPLPEDHFALSGDVVVLFVYTYVDHITNALFYEASRMDLSQLVTATLDPRSSVALPVWFDLIT